MPPTLSGQSKPALAALILGGMVIGASPVFVRLSEVGAVPTAFWRLALALVPLFLLARRSGAGGQARPRGLHQIWLVSLPGLILGTELVAWHISLHMTSVANSTLLVNMTPIFVALYSWLILRRPPGRLFLFALALTLLGVVVLKGGPAALGDGHLAGDAVAVFAAVLYAAYLVVLARVRETFAAPVIMLWSTAAAALAVLPFALAGSGAMLPWTLAGWLVLFGLSWLSQAGGQSLIAWALAWLPATFSSLTLLLQPVVAALLAWAVLGEALTPWQALGGVIVLAGIWTARLAQKRSA